MGASASALPTVLKAFLAQASYLKQVVGATLNFEHRTQKLWTRLGIFSFCRACSCKWLRFKARVLFCKRFNFEGSQPGCRVCSGVLPE